MGESNLKIIYNCLDNGEHYKFCCTYNPGISEAKL